MHNNTAHDDTTPLFLHRLEIRDFMGVEHEAIELNGNHLVIAGSNASGKTSRLTALYAALAGVSVRDIPDPIRRGADKATVRADLGEYVIELTITASGPRLVVTAADGSKIRRGRDLLDGLLGAYSLDPSVFLGRRPQDQVDDVLAICGVRPPVDEVEQILGERIEPSRGETAEQYLMRLSADETGLLYIRRREANRQLEQQKGALLDAREIFDKLGGPIRDGEVPPSTATLLERQQNLISNQQARFDAQKKVDAAVQGVREAEAWKSKYEGEISHWKADIDDVDAKIKALQDQRERLIQSIRDREADLAETINDNIPQAQRVLADARQALAQLPDPADALAAIRQQIAGAEAAREVHAERIQQSKTVDRLIGEVEASRGRHDALDKQLDQLRDLRKRLLENLDLGVPGLSVSSGELHLRGVALRQCSTREQLAVALNVAMRQSGKVRILRVDNAERMDQASIDYLHAEAGRRGWQVISAAVSNDQGAPRIEIVERVAESAGVA